MDVQDFVRVVTTTVNDPHLLVAGQRVPHGQNYSLTKTIYMNAPKTTIHFVKAFTCTVPVWDDGKRTDETEERVKALFVARLAGISRGTFGSCFMEPGSTVESVESAWSTDFDYSEHLRMQPVEGSDFAKVVVK